MLATIDPIALRLGPISIHWYAICIVSGLLLAVYLAQRLAPEKGINPEHILDFILLAFPIAIVGARLYYVIFSGLITAKIHRKFLRFGMVELLSMVA